MAKLEGPRGIRGGLSHGNVKEPSVFDVGDRVSWDRADLPRGVGTIVLPEPGHVEGWYRVSDDHYGVFLFPEEQLKKSRAKVPE